MSGAKQSLLTFTGLLVAALVAGAMTFATLWRGWVVRPENPLLAIEYNPFGYWIVVITGSFITGMCLLMAALIVFANIMARRPSGD